jgi:hypothetical protein
MLCVPILPSSVASDTFSDKITVTLASASVKPAADMWVGVRASVRDVLGCSAALCCADAMPLCLLTTVAQYQHTHVSERQIMKDLTLKLITYSIKPEHADTSSASTHANSSSLMLPNEI